MIVDTFTFFNELDMLKYRLELLGPLVDKFVLVEATVSYRGLPKRLYYEENKHLFEPWNSKIIHVILDDLIPNAPDPWLNEFEQRNRIAKHITFMKDDDILINSDLDEIPDPEVVKKLPEILAHQDAVSLGMDLYYYNIETRVIAPWNFPKAMRYSFSKRDALTHIRQYKLPVIPEAGWHLSYFGDASFILNKLNNFAHYEAYNLYDNEEQIRLVIKHRMDPFSRDDICVVHQPWELNPHPPPMYRPILRP